jgi:hypothetical protein
MRQLASFLFVFIYFYTGAQTQHIRQVFFPPFFFFLEGDKVFVFYKVVFWLSQLCNEQIEFAS